jgi:hypothetical protein
MPKTIMQVSYWLGITFVVVAFIWRVANAAGIWLPRGGVGYMSFFKGAILFLLAAVATASYAWCAARKS